METTFKKDRARYMGIWTLLITLGIPSGPFIFGFVTYRLGYQWIYWILAIVSVPMSRSGYWCNEEIIADQSPIFRSTVCSSSCISFWVLRPGILEATITPNSPLGYGSMPSSDVLTLLPCRSRSSSDPWAWSRILVLPSPLPHTPWCSVWAT